MSSNRALYINNGIQGVPAFFNVDPYNTASGPTVSVNESYSFESTKIKLGYSASNDAFAAFLMDNILNIVDKNSNGKIYKSFTDSYISSLIKDGSDITGYYEVPDVETADPDNPTETTKKETHPTHLAGTLFTFKITDTTTYSPETTPANFSFNAAILIDEVYSIPPIDPDTNLPYYNPVTINKINVKLYEPILQYLITTTGVVLDFQEGVTISDISDFIDSKEEETVGAVDKGYLKYKAISPSNPSKPANESLVENPSFLSDFKYTAITTGPPTNSSGTLSSGVKTSQTHLSCYFVFCAFPQDVSSASSKDLMYKKPYIVIFKQNISKVLLSQWAYVNEDLKDSSNADILTEELKTAFGVINNNSLDISLERLGLTIPMGEIFNNWKANSTSSCSNECNYYILKDMVESNQ